MATSFQVTFDCANPAMLANFWADALHYQLQPPPEGFESWEQFADANNIPEEKRGDIGAIIDPDGGPRVLFLRVPESKTVKNRAHLDLNVSDWSGTTESRRQEVDSEVQRLIGLGASRLNVMDEGRDYWVVMADPEGNEFCVQ